MFRQFYRFFFLCRSARRRFLRRRRFTERCLFFLFVPIIQVVLLYHLKLVNARVYDVIFCHTFCKIRCSSVKPFRQNSVSNSNSGSNPAWIRKKIANDTSSASLINPDLALTFLSLLLGRA